VPCISSKQDSQKPVTLLYVALLYVALLYVALLYFTLLYFTYFRKGCPACQPSREKAPFRGPLPRRQVGLGLIACRIRLAALHTHIHTHTHTHTRYYTMLLYFTLLYLITLHEQMLLYFKISSSPKSRLACRIRLARLHTHTHTPIVKAWYRYDISYVHDTYHDASLHTHTHTHVVNALHTHTHTNCERTAHTRTKRLWTQCTHTHTNRLWTHCTHTHTPIVNAWYIYVMHQLRIWLIMDMQSARIAGFHGNSISFPSLGGSRQIYTINPILIQ